MVIMICNTLLPLNFQCIVCHDLIKKPVTTPCRHNFCLVRMIAIKCCRSVWFILYLRVWLHYHSASEASSCTAYFALPNWTDALFGFEVYIVVGDCEYNLVQRVL